MTNPTVSVVMATYNGEHFLHLQLDSLLAQTYPIYEIIIQDDGSTDRTLDIAREYAAQHPHIHLYQNEKNQGWNLNFISAFQRAKGDYIAISDQDDIWFTHKIERQMAAIGKKDICFSFRYKDKEYTEHGRVLGAPQNSFECLLFTSIIPGHCILARTAFLQSIEEWNPDIPYDWWIAIQAYLHRGVARVDEALNWHRPHVESASYLLMSKSWKKAEQATWQPYVFGWAAFRRYQKRKDWQWFYAYIEQHTSDTFEVEAHRIAHLMRCPGWINLFQLCYLTMHLRAKIHQRFAGGKGLKRVRNAVRGFFYPCMLTYNKNMHFLGKDESSLT